MACASSNSRWESKLRDVEKVEQEYRRWKKEQATALSADDRARIAAFGIDLPGLWERIGNSHRKEMLRLVIDKVILDQRRAKGMVWIRIVWQTGATTEHWMVRKTQSYADAAHADVLEQKIRDLNGSGMMRQHAQCRRVAEQPGRNVRPQYGPPVAPALEYPHGQNQRRRAQPTALAGWQLLYPGRRNRAPGHRADGVQMAEAR
jgi:hypothetical protein